MNTIEFTATKVKALRRAYNAAVKAKKDTFIFEGSELVVTYAKYLLEYLDGEFRRSKS